MRSSNKVLSMKDLFNKHEGEWLSVAETSKQVKCTNSYVSQFVRYLLTKKKVETVVIKKGGAARVFRVAHPITHKDCEDFVQSFCEKFTPFLQKPVRKEQVCKEVEPPPMTDSEFLRNQLAKLVSHTLTLSRQIDTLELRQRDLLALVRGNDKQLDKLLRAWEIE